MSKSSTAVSVTMKGNPVVLLGADVAIGQAAPDAKLTANDLSETSISAFKGKKLIVCAVPSLDTPVCDTETRRFNQEAAKLGSDVKILVVSMDLPFAQKRWCAAAGISQVQTVSDHREASFGQNYGVLIKGPRLLARAIFVIDTKGTLRYKQIVPEITTEPNYTEVLDAVKKI